MNPLDNKNVAIVYDRVNKWGGAERVLLTLHEIFPQAPLYTAIYDSNSASWAKVFPKIYTSFLQNIPFAKSNHEYIGYLMPISFEMFNFSGYDLVISVTSEAAKGIITKPNTLHVCYLLTPTRYLWSHYNLYFKNPILRFFSKPVVNYLKKWDKIASNRPDEIIAISTEVQKRIKKYYGKISQIVFPPVNLSNNIEEINEFKEGKYYLVVSRLVSYKKVDLVVDTFNKLKLPLVIVGKGSEFNNLKLKAKNNIKFIGNISDKELCEYYKGAKALIMAQEEDFGITSIEAQGFGVPVIAYNRGGAKDTVVDGLTGVLFENQNIKSLTSAIAKCSKISFNHKYLVENAKNFSKERFKENLQRSLIRAYSSRGWGNSSLA
jgi:glycosyltransferase involved in cell wall biosynthesis